MSFIPQSAKEFSYREGDLLLSSGEKSSAFCIQKIIKIEKIIMKKGDAKIILNQRVEAPEDDFFLVVAYKTTDYIYKSVEEAKTATISNNIAWKIGYIPGRPFKSSKEVIGHQEVTDEELTTHNNWKELFDRGEAGVF